MYLQLKFGGKKTAQESQPAAAPMPVREFVPSPAPVASTPPPARNSNSEMGAPRIKTYVAESVPQAITLARREMGEDAILIQTHRRETADVSKRFEVTFGLVPGAAAPPPPPIKAAAKAPLKSKASIEAESDMDVARELGQLRRELAAMQTMLRQSPFGKPAALQENPAAEQAYDVMARNEIDLDTASEFVHMIEPGTDSAEEALGELLKREIRIDSSVAKDGKAVVLMGPAGAGKTTALIKIAVEYGLKLGNQIEIFSLSKGKTIVDRTLDAMTAILGVPCEALADAAALQAALDRPREEGTLVLIDANGYGVGTDAQEADLAKVLASGEKADVHLVLPAAWHRVSIKQSVDRFEIFQPARLLFTMVDQAAVYGPMIQEAWRTGKALSFVSSGTVGRTSLRPADLGWIVERMFEMAREAAAQHD